MFDDIIKAAREGGQTQQAAEVKEPSDNTSVRITVIGVGGAGCNCSNRIFQSGIKSAKTIAINTDGKHLNMIGAHKKILSEGP